MKTDNILGTIGNTPVVKLQRLFGQNHDVWIKLERTNPGNSIKDRIALAMIEEAEAKGLLREGSVIVEPTSGNTGIGLAMVAAVKGYELVLVMPDSMSIERRRLMQIFGAKLELTPREKGMKGAIEKAEELVKDLPNAWSPRQFDNPVNVRAHEETTAQEVLRDFPEGLDYVITGVGTGGHITALAKVLKAQFPALKVIAVEPELSPVLGGGAPSPHPLQGIGAGFVPAIYNPELIDEIVTVSKEDSFRFAQEIARREGILAGISTGAALAAVHKKLQEIPAGSRILTFNYDTGERYLSVEGLFS